MGFNHSKPSAGRKPTTSLQQGLARLPAELWQQILDLTLDTTPPIVHIDDRYLPVALHINRHTRATFAPAYYANTIFTARPRQIYSEHDPENPAPLWSWLTSLTAEDRAAITEIRLVGPCNQNINSHAAIFRPRPSGATLRVAMDTLRWEERELNENGWGVGEGVLHVLVLFDVPQEDGSLKRGEERWMNFAEIVEMFDKM